MMNLEVFTWCNYPRERKIGGSSLLWIFCHFIIIESFKYEIILKFNLSFSKAEYKIPRFLLIIKRKYILVGK